jgi:hypothetical protein
MKVTIESLEGLSCSVNGNPRYKVHYSFVGLGSHYDSAITKSDSAFNYEIGNPGYRAGDTVELSFTKAGRISAIESVAS